MPWWAWLLLGWAGVAMVCAVWWGRALAHADRQERARREPTVEQCDVSAQGRRRHGGPAGKSSSIPHARRPLTHHRHTPSR